jgi:hypothetical protein
MAARMIRAARWCSRALAFSCHGWTCERSISPFATLIGAQAANDPSDTSAAQILISWTRRHRPDGAVSMLSFGDVYSDVEIATLANSLTARLGSKGSTAHRAGRGRG